MGIGRQAAKDLLVAIKAGTAGKQELRDQLSDVLRVVNDKLTALDYQIHQAKDGFASDRATQFKTYLDGLPDVGEPGPGLV